MTTTTLFIKTLIASATVVFCSEITYHTTGGLVDRPTFWQMMTFAIALCIWVEMVTSKEPEE